MYLEPRTSQHPLYMTGRGRVGVAESFVASSVRRRAEERSAYRDSVETQIMLASLRVRANELEAVHWPASRPTGGVLRPTGARCMKLSKPAIITAVALGAILVVGIWFAANYNSLVSNREDVDNSWVKVETQYQRRFDLVGNLVESVKGSHRSQMPLMVRTSK
jgi:hypothetical protein